MVSNKSKHYPAVAQLRDMIDSTSRREHNIYIDAQHIAEQLMGDHMASNLLLVGVAYQAGALPIPADAIEDAIRLNGTAIDMNVQARKEQSQTGRVVYARVAVAALGQAPARHAARFL
jgi:indolepyruvate ferredoxin oxidoreductase